MYALPSQAMTSAVASRSPTSSTHAHANGGSASPLAHHHDENYEDEEDDEEDDDDDYEDDDEEGDDDDGEDYEDEVSERGSIGSRSNRSSMGRSVTGVVGTGGGSNGNEYFNFGTVKGADPLLTAAFYNGIYSFIFIFYCSSSSSLSPSPRSSCFGWLLGWVTDSGFAKCLGDIERVLLSIFLTLEEYGSICTNCDDFINLVLCLFYFIYSNQRRHTYGRG